MNSKYKKILVLFLFICALSVILKPKNKTIEIKGIKYAVSVEGVRTSSFPAKGAYDVSLTCEGAEVTWNYEEWVLEIKNANSNALCNISFDKKTAINLNAHIKGLVTSGGGTVSYSNGSTLENVDNNYIYRGPNPENYIKFNGELWRIIGVFNSESHGQSGYQLVKIIRNSSLGSITWDDRVCGTSSGGGHPIFPYLGSNYFTGNDFAVCGGSGARIGSYIYNLLNKEYYNSENTTCVVSIDNPFVGDSNQYFMQCDFSNIGLKKPYKDMITSVIWYPGGRKNATVRTHYMYTAERCRDGNGCDGTPHKSTGLVGLMYLSDYGYAAPASCTNSVVLSNYSTPNCVNNNWLKSDGNEWTVTKSTELESYVFFIDSEGNANYTAAGYGKNIRPVVYLKSNVYLISGTGTMTDPYIIGM